MNNDNYKTTIKTWWRPLWAGLVIDREGKHSRQIKTAVWLFLYLILVADAKTGIASKSYSEMSRETGRKIKTLKKWMAILKKNGYVSTEKERKGMTILIRKWKFVGKDSKQRPVLYPEKEVPPVGVRYSPRLAPIGELLKDRRHQYSNDKMRNQQSYDDIDKYIDNNVVRNSINLNNGNVRFSSKEESLAIEVAHGLNDMDNLKVYLSYCRKLPEDLVRRVYQEVKNKPTDKIKKSRGALFTYLIQKLCREK